MIKRVFLILIFSVSNVYAEQALVAVAANFTQTASTLKQQFEAQTEHSIKLSFGSTGKLYAQIVNGAPYDVFLAADEERPEKLEKDGLSVADTRITYALGQLVLWSQEIDISEMGLKDTQFAKIRRFAIANPALAPYGRGATDTLAALGLSEMLQDKLVMGESVSQAFQFIATGNAEAGLIAKAQLHAWKGSKGFSWDVPQRAYSEIKQQAILLTRSKTNNAAKAFLDFLKSEQARSIIQQHGYALASTDNIKY